MHGIGRMGSILKRNISQISDRILLYETKSLENFSLYIWTFFSLINFHRYLKFIFTKCKLIIHLLGKTTLQSLLL